MTLLFYALAVVLASRLPGRPDARLAAAGIAALNPLVYWHQIFGANDVVFVAMLLGAVLLLPGRPPPRGGRSPRARVRDQAARVAVRPVPAAVGVRRAHAARARRARAVEAARGAGRGGRRGVPASSWLPVAALDFRAFWSDIVAYNVGLPGADNYPLGGTPGFGVANFLIYAGRVASLRDYFPFSVFYVLLVPLGVLLARAQVHYPRVEWALVTGTAALVASLYFSRVVHPNYLVAAAILLPVAVVACGRHAAHRARARCCSSRVAVEIVENGLFRTVPGSRRRPRATRRTAGPASRPRSRRGRGPT